MNPSRIGTGFRSEAELEFGSHAATISWQVRIPCKKSVSEATNRIRTTTHEMRNGNPETLFKTWLQEHSAIVFKVARAYTLTEEDRKDLVQDILLQLWVSLPQFEGKAKPSTWVYRVALNTALASHRKDRRQRRQQTPLLEVEDVSAVGNEDAQRLHNKEVVEHLYAAIRQLPKADAAVVLLYLDDASYREMAEVLGISESNVGVKLNRVRKALAELMKEVAHES